MWRYTMCILIGQYHQFTIAQCVQIRFIVICSIIVQAPGTNQIVNLIILFHRLLLTFAHIQYLALDRHYPIALSLLVTQGGNATQRTGLCRVTLRDDQYTRSRMPTACLFKSFSLRRKVS